MKIFSLTLLLILLVGCGSDSGKKELKRDVSTTSNKVLQSEALDKKTADFLVGKDNTVHDTKGEFGDYTVVVYTDHKIGEDEISPNVYQIYGKVDSIDFLLGLNANYPSETQVVIKVFSKDGKLLKVGEVKKLGKTVKPVNMGNLTIK